MYPSYADCQRGRRYTRKIGSSIFKMYKKDVVYIVSINGNNTGHMTYDRAIEHLIHLIRTEGVTNGGREGQGGTVRRLQGHGDTGRRGY
jgi:hypothetical protein